MTRYEAIEKALQKLIADYESEIHDNYDGTSFLSYRMAEVHDAKDALALPEDSKTVNAELYGLAMELADSAAQSRIESMCVLKDGWFKPIPIMWSKETMDRVSNALRYLSLRESSCEPMPYRVVRDDDKVRFE